MHIDLTRKSALVVGAAARRDLLDGIGASLSAAGAAVTRAELAPDLPGEEAYDIVVIAAGWRGYGPFLELTRADVDSAIETNFEVPTLLAQAAARRQITAGRGGRIIFLTGVEGLMPFAGAALLGTSLSMLWPLAKMAAVDLAPHGITVNVVAPGWLAMADTQALPEAVRAHIAAGIPGGAPGHPADVGSAVAFLASAQAAYITGIMLPVEGGYTLTRSSGRSLFER